MAQIKRKERSGDPSPSTEGLSSSMGGAVMAWAAEIARALNCLEDVPFTEWLGDAVQKAPVSIRTAPLARAAASYARHGVAA